MNIKQYRTQYKTLAQQGYFSYLSAILTMAIMPVHVQYLPPVMILWLLSWIFENHYRLKELYCETKTVYKLLFALVILYYLWQVSGLLYSADLKMGLLNLYGRLSLVLFPLVLIYPGENIRRKTKILLRVFAAGSFSYMLICFCFALFRSLNYQNGIWTFNPHPPEFWWLSYFYAAELTVNQHPSYIAIFVLISSLICFETWFDNSIKTILRYIWLFAGILLIVSIYFISSRAGIISCLIIIPVYLIRKLKERKKLRLAWIGIIILMIALLPLIIRNQRVNSLFKTFSDDNEMKETEKIIEPRLIIWKAALNIAKQNLFIGVGIGDVRTELVKEYQKVGEDIMIKERYNAHNQFIEVLLENGLIGLVVFIMIFIIMIYIAIVDRNLLYGCFIFMIAFSLMFETMLYRLAGVSFFSLFSFQLLYYKPHRQED